MSGASGAATPPLDPAQPSTPSVPAGISSAPVVDATEVVDEVTSSAQGVICAGDSRCETLRAGPVPEVSPYHRWDVEFADSILSDAKLIQGSICLHLPSRWITIRDVHDDILAGRYLHENEYPHVGEVLDIDGFHLL
ncbi:hypothetical protein ZWY2020_053926 [Hordeum vulgare]|nr:hypothetical protein ZWY2020_053926 [Hordeum vulgare]